MDNGMPWEALLVAEASGGHLIPAMELARALAARGASVRLWHPPRAQVRWLTDRLASAEQTVKVEPLPVPPGRGLWARAWSLAALWRHSRRAFARRRPDVVVGFGGWVSVPVLLAARQQGIPCVIHEQNVDLGRANQWLAPRVDKVAVSFAQTQHASGMREAVCTGLPVREEIGAGRREAAAAHFGLEVPRLTVLVLGGSQGSERLNTLWTQAAARLGSEERCRWQVVHVTGAADEARVLAVYAEHGVAAWAAASLQEMAHAYALADVAVARAGASTAAELSRCGVPSVLIPYPLARGHQRANARLLAAAGGAVVIEDAEADAGRVLGAVRELLADAPRRGRMSRRLRALDVPDATQRLAEVICDVASLHAR